MDRSYEHIHNELFVRTTPNHWLVEQFFRFQMPKDTFLVVVVVDEVSFHREGMESWVLATVPFPIPATDQDFQGTASLGDGGSSSRRVLECSAGTLVDENARWRLFPLADDTEDTVMEKGWTSRLELWAAWD